MIDMPERIWAEVSPNSGDEWWTAEPSDLGKATLTEYIRADLPAADAKAHKKEIAVWAENYAALERQLAEAREALTLILPLAKGYAAVNRHDVNRRVIEIAEAVLT